MLRVCIRHGVTVDLSGHFAFYHGKRLFISMASPEDSKASESTFGEGMDFPGDNVGHVERRYLFRVIVPYVLFSALWILLSDLALSAVVTDQALHTKLSIYKGWFFILTTALLLGWLLRIEYRQRLRMGEELQLSKLKYLTAFRNSPDMFIISEMPEGKLVDANTVFAEAFGGRDKVLGRTAGDLGMWLTEADRTLFYQLVAASGGDLRNHPCKVNIGGRIREVIVSATKISTGEKSYLFTNGHDITELMEKERALRAQQNWLERAERVGRIGCWSLNRRTGEVWSSSETKRIFGVTGLSDEKAAYEECKKAVLPEFRGILRSATHKLLDGTEPFDVEFRLRRRSDGLFVDVHSVAEYDAESGTIFGVLQDISRRKTVESRMVELAALLDIASDAIYIRDTDHTIRYWNKGAERLYGWEAEEVLGQMTTDLFSKDLSVVDAVQSALHEHGSWAGELKHLARDGKQVIVFSRLTLVRNPDGTQEAVMAINTDITEQKRMEAQYLRAQRLESLGALSSGIAHDLNNVLAPILMAVPLLREEFRSESAQTLLSTINTSAQRGADVVKQVLTFARGAQGDRILLQPEHLLRETFKIVSETFPKNIKVRLDEESEVWPILGDSTQVHQSLMNLCVNARDAMTEEGGTLTLGIGNVVADPAFIKAAGGTKPGPYVCLRVSDTGSGIAPALMDKIFEPFFTTKSPGQGTGLGLSTVLGILKGHGGFVRVQSEMGRGTRFELYFPASPSSEGEKGRDAESRNQAPAAGRGETILVVDDEPALQEVFRRLLVKHGYEVLIAGDGSEAVGLYVQHKAVIALVITDMMMPGMDGVALIKVLRRLQPELHIIGMSGVGDHNALKTQESLHLDAFLPKPCKPDVLLKTVHEALRNAW